MALLLFAGTAWGQVTATTQPGALVVAKSPTAPMVWEISPSPPEGSTVLSKSGVEWRAWLLPGTYRLMAVEKDGSFAGRTIIVGSDPGPPPTPDLPIVIVAATPSNINLGDAATLIWSITDADSATMTEDGSAVIQDIAMSGTLLVSPKKTTTYTFRGVNKKGEQIKTITIFVGGLPPPPVSMPWVVMVSDFQKPSTDPGVVGILSGTAIAKEFSARKWVAPDGALTYASVSKAPKLGDNLDPKRKTWIEASVSKANSCGLPLPVMVWTDASDGQLTAEALQKDEAAQLKRIKELAGVK